MFSRRHVQSIIDHLLCYGKLVFPLSLPTHKWHTLLPCVSPVQSCWSSWWPFVHGDWSNGSISPLSYIVIMFPFYIYLAFILLWSLLFKHQDGGTPSAHTIFFSFCLHTNYGRFYFYFKHLFEIHSYLIIQVRSHVKTNG